MQVKLSIFWSVKQATYSGLLLRFRCSCVVVSNVPAMWPLLDPDRVKLPNLSNESHLSNPI